MQRKQRNATLPNSTGVLLRLVLLSAATATLSVRGQQISVPDVIDRAFVEKLVQQMNQQAEEIKALKSARNGPPAEASTTAAAAAQPTYPNLQFHGFGDVDYQAATRAVNNDAQTTGVNYQTAGRSPGSYNQFYFGEIDLFVTSQLSETFGSLLETVISAGTDNHTGVDIERVELSWNPRDYFNVDVGRFHTQMGYYNTAYHHGTWFQNAVGRPSFLEFEDSGGLLPVHTVGMSVHGAIPSGNWNLSYFLEAGNGRSYPTNGNNPVQNLVDDNGFKAVNIALVAKPDWFPGGQFGVGLYHDIVTPDGLARTDELIPNAHLAYHSSTWEFLAEGFIIRHKPEQDSAHYSPMFYVQVAHKFGLFTPYARLTYYNASQNDLIYSSVLQQAGVHYGPSLGLRYDVSSYVAIKTQYDYMMDTDQPSASAFTVQAAFTF